MNKRKDLLVGGTAATAAAAVGVAAAGYAGIGVAGAKGYESESPLTRSPLMALDAAAARRNNETAA